MFTSPSTGISSPYQTLISPQDLLNYTPYLVIFFGFLLLVGIVVKIFQVVHHRITSADPSSPTDSAKSSVAAPRQYQMPTGGWPTPK